MALAISIKPNYLRESRDAIASLIQSDSKPSRAIPEHRFLASKRRAWRFWPARSLDSGSHGMAPAQFAGTPVLSKISGSPIAYSFLLR